MSKIQTGFLPGPAGSLHVALFLPEDGPGTRWILHIPAFTEEMNKCRGMVARQARLLADLGYVVVVPDFTGTGDSSGRLQDASWDGWLNDLHAVIAWAREQGAQYLVLWGNRLGSLMAAQLATELLNPPDQLLLWQPVHSGRQHMTQFLRLRMAAGLATGSSDTTAGLRGRLLDEGVLEVAGYMLPAGLFLDIESRSLADFMPPPGCETVMLEVASEADRPVLPITAKLVEKWTAQGSRCLAGSVQGDPFWMTQELGFSPKLLEATLVHVGWGVTQDDSLQQRQGGQARPVELLSGNLAPETPEGNRAMVFSCEESDLVGVLHGAGLTSDVGVVIVVGGPQYRVGSHRQFYLLAQRIAEAGMSALCFDYRGMGDSSGTLKGFENIERDINSAVNSLLREKPEISRVVLWGLCDAATAAMSYAGGDERIAALILANPWVYSASGSAKAYIRHYYLRRVLQPEFWSKVWAGEFKFKGSLISALGLMSRALGLKPCSDEKESKGGEQLPKETSINPGSEGPNKKSNLVEQFTGGMRSWKKPILLLLSGSDLTAAEFLDACRGNRNLGRAIRRQNVTVCNFPGVDHTFSREDWRFQVERLSTEYLSKM